MEHALTGPNEPHCRLHRHPGADYPGAALIFRSEKSELKDDSWMSLPNRIVASHAPDTHKRVARFAELPLPIRNTFEKFVTLHPSMKVAIKDRREAWSGGCLANEIHFLEAGQTRQGWWVYYETTGIVDAKRLVFIAVNKGQPQVGARYSVNGSGNAANIGE